MLLTFYQVLVILTEAVGSIRKDTQQTRPILLKNSRKFLSQRWSLHGKVVHKSILPNRDFLSELFHSSLFAIIKFTSQFYVLLYNSSLLPQNTTIHPTSQPLLYSNSSSETFSSAPSADDASVHWEHSTWAASGTTLGLWRACSLGSVHGTWHFITCHVIRESTLLRTTLHSQYQIVTGTIRTAW